MTQEDLPVGFEPLVQQRKHSRGSSHPPWDIRIGIISKTKQTVIFRLSQVVVRHLHLRNGVRAWPYWNRVDRQVGLVFDYKQGNKVTLAKGEGSASVYYRVSTLAPDFIEILNGLPAQRMDIFGGWDRLSNDNLIIPFGSEQIAAGAEEPELQASPVCSPA